MPQEFPTLAEEIRAHWQALFPGTEFQGVERVGGGGNNRIFKVVSEKKACILKIYYRDPSDTRDRLKTDFLSHKFLWENGVRCIAEPLAQSGDCSCAAYEFIEGVKRAPEEITEADLDQTLSFVESLKRLSKNDAAKVLGPGSETTFCLKDLLTLIEGRLSRLEKARQDETPAKGDFNSFFNRLSASFSMVRAEANSHLKQCGIAGLEAELPQSARTLSPSDFGFHNALLRADGSFAFLDFEYFGWDDPAKLVSDFILHPAMMLGVDLQRHFVKKAVRIFEEDRTDPKFAARLSLVYPLYGIKWCCIILNEFVPEYRARRGFAGKIDNATLAEKLVVQLEKAAKTLDLIEARSKVF